MFKVSPASLQMFIDTPNSVLEDCVQYRTFHIPNVFCVGYLLIINIFACFCTVIRCTETFLSPLIMVESIVIKLVVRYLRVR
jgi:hypothetical protein